MQAVPSDPRSQTVPFTKASVRGTQRTGYGHASGTQSRVVLAYVPATLAHQQPKVVRSGTSPQPCGTPSASTYCVPSGPGTGMGPSICGMPGEPGCWHRQPTAKLQFEVQPAMAAPPHSKPKSHCRSGRAGAGRVSRRS